MKKLKFFLSLLMLFTFSLGTMWAAQGDTIYTCLFSDAKAASYTMNGTITLKKKDWKASVYQVSSGVFYLGCNSGNASKGLLAGTGSDNPNNAGAWDDAVAAWEAADAKYGTDKHAYALRFDSLCSSVGKVVFAWEGGNNAFVVFLFGDKGSGLELLDSTNYATSGTTVADSIVWTGTTANFSKFVIVARPGAKNGNATNKTLRAKKFAVLEGSTGPSVTVVDNETRDPWDEIDFGNVGKSWDESVTFGLDCKKMEAGTMTLTVPSGFSFSTSETTLTKDLSVSAGNNSFSYITIYKDTETAGDIDDELTFTGAGLPSGGVTVPLKMSVKNPVISVTKNSSPITEIDLGTYYAYSFGTTVRDTVHFSGHYLPKYRELLLTANATTYFEAVGAASNYNHIWSDTEGDLDIDVAIEGHTYHSAGTYYYIDGDPEEGRYKISLKDPWTSSIDPVDVYCEMTLISSNSVRVYTSGTDDGEFSIRVYDNSDKLQEKTISNYDISGYYHDENDIIVVEAEPAIGYEFSSWNLSGVSSDINILSGEDGPQLRFKMNSVKNIVFSANFTQTCLPLTAPEKVTGYPTVEWNGVHYTATFKWNEVANASGYTINVHNIADGDTHSADFNVDESSMTIQDGVVTCEISGLQGDYAEYSYTIMATGSGSYCAENYTTVGTVETDEWPEVTLTLHENGETSIVNFPFNEEPTLPSTSDAGCLDKVFVGWALYSSASSAGDVTFAPGAAFTNPLSSLAPDLYAVYAVDESAWNVATSITAGDVVVFSTNPAYTEHDMKTAGNISSQIFTCKASTYNGDKSKITELADGTLEFLVGGNSTDGWTFKNGDNYLKVTGDKKVGWDDVYTWTYDVSFDGNVATIQPKEDYTSYKLQYNYNGGADRFTFYTSDQIGVSLYKKNVQYSGYSTTCNGLDNSLNVTFSVPEGAYTEAKNVTLGSLSGTTIYYTLDGSDPSSSATRIEYTAPVALNTSGSFTIKAFAISSTAHSSVTQAAYTISLPLTTMDQIFARAKQVGSTATDVTVTLNNWVVTGVNGNNAYITDGTKGFILYSSGHGFSVNDKLSGTVACKVQLYNGAAEITSLTSSTTGLTRTTDGVVTPVETAITALDSVNSGAPIIVSNVEYNGTYLVDAGDNQIKPYNKLYSGMSFTNGKKYNVTGIYLQFNATKQIMPRSAADIVEVKESAGLEWSAASATVTYGAGDNEFPSLTNPHSVTVAYSSTNTAVATIESNGAITLLKAGETTIKATLSGDATYADAEVSYTLTVNKGDAELEWSAASATVKIGADDNVFPTLSNPHSVSVSYSCSHTSLATIDSEGVITLIEGGGVDATITATLSGDDKYADAVVSYTLTIKRGDPALAWKISDATVDAATVTIEAGDNVFPTLYNPHNLAVTYSSSKTDTATINSSTGAISLVGAGKTTITASFAGSGAYNSGSASYTLTVNPKTKPAAPISWYNTNPINVKYGVGEYLNPYTYKLLVNDENLDVTVTSSNTAVVAAMSKKDGEWRYYPAAILSCGTTTITATFAGNDDYAETSVSYTLNINKGDATQCRWTGLDDGVKVTTFYEMFTSPNFKHDIITDGTLEFSSTNTAVATVANDGKVTRVGAGTATISAIISNDSFYRDTTISFPITVNKATLNLSWQYSSSIVEGVYTLDQDNGGCCPPGLASASPLELSDITLVSDNTEVATISGSNVNFTGKAGEANITASYAGSDYVSAAAISYKLIVTQKHQTVTFAQPDHGTLQVFNGLDELESGDAVNKGATLTVVATPASGYKLATLTAGGVSILSTKEFVLDDDMTVVATFEAAPVITVTPNPVALDLGQVVLGDDCAKYGQSFHLNITNLKEGQYNEIVVHFSDENAFYTSGNNHFVDLDQDGEIDTDVTVVPSEYWMGLTPAVACGVRNADISITSINSQFDATIVGTVTMTVVESATALDDLESGEKVVKVLDNGVVYIIRDGARYNLLGEKVK